MMIQKLEMIKMNGMIRSEVSHRHTVRNQKGGGFFDLVDLDFNFLLCTNECKRPLFLPNIQAKTKGIGGA